MTATTPRERYLQRRAHRLARPPKDTARMPRGFTREQQVIDRIVKRKLRAGRPGRLGDAATPTFDWEKVAKASQKAHWREGDNRPRRSSTR